MSLTDQERVTLVRRGLEDPIWFFQFFLKDWFPLEMPWVHQGIVALILRKTEFLQGYPHLDKIISNFVFEDTVVLENGEEENILHPLFRLEDDGTITLISSRYLQIRLPRGFSKTTLLNAINIYCTCYRIFEFPFYLSETASHAETQLGNIKRQFENNEKIHEVFGTVVPDRMASQKWNEKELQTLTGVTYKAKGRGGQVRGNNVDAKRPDFIVVDDVEDEESVQTFEQRKKTRKWFYAAVLPALKEIGDANSRVVVLGTLLDADALLVTLENDPAWVTVNFGAKDRQGDLLWEAMMNEKKLELKKKSMTLAGELSSYYREYFNLLRGEDGQKFKEEFFKFGIISPTEFVGRALVIDPAISEKPDADFCGFGVVGMEEKGMIHILHADGEQGMTPREQIDEYFRLGKIWKPTKFGVESIAYQAALIHLIREEMFRQKLYFEIIPITHGQKKTTRVEGVLQPRFAGGWITMRQKFPLLMTQLLDWPLGKKDIPDAVAMAITLLDPYAGMAGNNVEEGENRPSDDQYEPLINWRHAP